MADRIEPFMVGVDGAALDDLRERLQRTRWPERETVSDWSQGVPLGYLQDLCGYWASRYDWRATEARINQIPQFTTRIDGLEVHFLHLRSPHPDAIPLIMTHGWPGSFFEFERVLGPLTDPPAHGGDAADAFDVVVPSLPGFGFSGKPAATGWDIHRIARAWAELMTRLGYDRFLAQGSDWGTSVSTSLALHQPGRLPGSISSRRWRHRPPCRRPDQPRTSRAGRSGRTQPHRIGLLGRARHQAANHRLLADRFTGRAVRLDRGETVGLDRRPRRSQPGPHRRSGAGQHLLVLADRHRRLLRPAVLGGIAEVTQWFTTAARDVITVPAGCSVFPKEVPRPSRRQAQRRFANIVYWSEPDRGGHFAAWEQPALFVDEVRAVARSCHPPTPALVNTRGGSQRNRTA